MVVGGGVRELLGVFRRFFVRWDVEGWRLEGLAVLVDCGCGWVVRGVQERGGRG